MAKSISISTTIWNPTEKEMLKRSDASGQHDNPNKYQNSNKVAQQ